MIENVTLVAGLRYTKEEKEFDYVNTFGDRASDGLTAADDGYLTLFWRDLVGESEWFDFDGDIDVTNVSGKKASSTVRGFFLAVNIIYMDDVIACVRNIYSLRRNKTYIQIDKFWWNQ